MNRAYAITLRAVYVLLGAGAVANGLYMLATPDAWFHHGPPGVTHTGPMNAHFVRDVGVAFVVVGGGLLWSAANLQRCRPMHMLVLAFFGGHAALHVYDILSGGLPESHWRLDALGVFAPAIMLAVLALPPVWTKLNPESVAASG